MGSKIDSIDTQMLQIHQRCTQGSGEKGKQISQAEAIQLISRAKEINENHSSSYSDDNVKGNNNLLRMLDKYQKDFSPESEKLIQKYLRTGKIPTVVSAPANSASSNIGPSTPREPHVSFSTPMVSGTYPPSPASTPHQPNAFRHGNFSAPAITSGAINPASPGSNPIHPNEPGHGNSGATPLPTSPSTPVDTGNVGGAIGPYGKTILDFTAKKSTWGCHWFPMQETRPGGDATNNLYAENGPLAKYDLLTGSESREYEWNHHRKAVDAGKDFSWWGHCNNAAEAACVLPEPKHSVTITKPDGTTVKFSRNDIQGLLVKCTPFLVDRVDFKGERFDSPTRNNPNDPNPALFVQVMKDWAQEGIPFVLDIDRREQVWNFPYDRCKIYESDKVPEGVSGVPSGAKYYHIEMSGTGFPEKNRVYECWVNGDGASAWVKTPNTHNNPDFMWRPHVIGNVLEKSTWVKRGNPSNPLVDPQIVYDIYTKSLA